MISVKKFFLSLFIATSVFSLSNVMANSNSQAYITCDVHLWDEMANITAIEKTIQSLKIDNASITIHKTYDVGYGVKRLRISATTNSKSINMVLETIKKSHPDIMSMQLVAIS